MLTSCSSQDTTQSYSSLEELNGQDMGCMSGSIFDKLIESTFPDSKITYYNSRSELLLALKSEKITGFISDEPVAMMMIAQNPDVTYMAEPVGYVDYGLCFSEDNLDVRDQFNAYLAEITESGHKDELIAKWIQPKGASQKMEPHTLTGENGTLKCTTTPDAAPFSFQSEGEFQGFEVELLYEFADRYGYNIQIETLNFDALLTAVATDKYDLALNGIYITPERAKSVNFSDPTYRGNDVVMILHDSVKEDVSIIESIKNSFYRNFIEEDRYLLLLQGVLTTIIISIVSILLGTIAGYLFFLLSKSDKTFKKIMDLLQTILAGLPTMIILMMLFYVVFNKSKLSGTVISIVGFSLIFATVNYGLLKQGTDAIDNGQREAALALGYNEWGTLVKMITPQGVRIVLPSYEAEIVSLIKNTSIVGYVSVNDLTRMSDIIRGRTYDAFFPLIFDAIIYFVFSYAMVRLIDFYMRKATDKLNEKI